MGSPRTFSTGYEHNKLASYVSLFRHFWKTRNRAHLSQYEQFQKARAVFDRYGTTPIAESKILEIGSGQRYPVTLLFHSLGAAATGIDMDLVEPRPTLRTYLVAARKNGWERALKTLVRAILFDRPFYRALGKTFRAPLRRAGVDLRVMDARTLEFPDQSFDYACSFSVFEHINDIDAATRELSRVLKPSGVAYIVVHLFPCISGGHHFEWMNEDRPSTRVPPWDHLRENRYPTQPFLNKLRERDYLTTFSKYLTVKDVTSKYQGEHMLTPEIERELSAYSREELLKNSIAVVLGKP